MKLLVCMKLTNLNKLLIGAFFFASAHLLFNIQPVEILAQTSSYINNENLFDIQNLGIIIQSFGTNLQYTDTDSNQKTNSLDFASVSMLNTYDSINNKCTTHSSPHGYNSNVQLDNCIHFCMQSTRNSRCEISLGDGTYNLARSVSLPSNILFQSLNLNKDSVVLNRAAALMGPIISLTGVNNVQVQFITVNGQKMKPQTEKPLDNVNIHIEDCVDCTIKSVNSENSRLSSIDVQSAHNLTIEDNYVHDNGTPEDVIGQPFLRSDGITLHAVTGNSSVKHNYFMNNTDIDFVIGGGSQDLLVISDNTIAPRNMSQINGQFLTGAAFLFDTNPNWSSLCRNSTNSQCAAEFSAVKFINNVNNCGNNCVYGLGIGTRLNNHWGYPEQSLVVKGLVIDETNLAEKVTMNSINERSNINPLSTFCRSSTDSISGSYNTSKCSPCIGKQYLNSAVPADGTICDFWYDSGYRE